MTWVSSASEAFVYRDVGYEVNLQTDAFNGNLMATLNVSLGYQDYQ
mgnify:CR=1 FL=1